jgi:hypothetical protein
MRPPTLRTCGARPQQHAFAVLAWHHAAADLIGFTFGRPALPVGKLKAA